MKNTFNYTIQKLSATVNGERREGEVFSREGNLGGSEAFSLHPFLSKWSVIELDKSGKMK
jgi:hypothetical protein